MIKIDKNIPTPDCGTHRGAAYPFKHMEIGDSFFLNLDDTDYKDIRSLANSIAQAASHHGYRNDRKYTLRTLKDENGVRVWRKR